MEKRSCWPLILGLNIVMIMALLGYIHLKRESVNKLANEMEFVQAAVRETDLGLENYGLAVEHTQTEMDNAEKEVKELQDEVGKLTSAKAEKDKEVQACKDSAVSNVDQYIIYKYLQNTIYNTHIYTVYM